MAIENLYDAISLNDYLGTAVSTRTKADASATGGRQKSVPFRVEMTAAASATSTYTIARIPADARLLSGLIWWDDLASTGSPTLDIGLFAVNSNITSDDDAINDGLDAATANTSGVAIIKTPVDRVGKKAYELVSGQTTNPGGELDVKITLQDADCNTGGTIAGVLTYTVK